MMICILKYKISNYLDCHNILYIRQYRNLYCKNEKTLPFDFYLPDFNILIEFDGAQHFVPTLFRCKPTIVKYGEEWYELAIKNYKNIKHRDDIKNKFAKDNNIPLYRIKYNKNVEKEMKKILANYITFL